MSDAWLSATPDPYAIPLERLDPANPVLFQRDIVLPYFERLRREDPVHFTEKSRYGPYWSITRYDDIVAVNLDHETFSSWPTISIHDVDEDMPLPMFIAQDPPKHGPQRRAVAPVAGVANLERLEPLIRQRVSDILDALPIGEAFDWMDRVGTELSSMTLATLLDFPQSERRLLMRWADAASNEPGDITAEGQGRRRAELQACIDRFSALWDERSAGAPRDDLISMVAHAEATRDMDRTERLGALVLMIVAGSDTTRNAIAGSMLGLCQFPDQFAAIKAEPDLVPDMISETMRWHTPAPHMRRIARREVEFGGKRIRRGDKVVMWHLSGNRDERVMERPDDFWVRRPNVRRHLSYGQGIHRCIGARLGELQLQILWEEMLKRFGEISIVGQPIRTASCFARGFRHMPVRLESK